MNPIEIQQLIESGLANAEAHVEGDGTHFSAVVVCPLFTGKSRLAKQRLVYETVKQPLLDGTLHALSIQAFSPEEWETWKN